MTNQGQLIKNSILLLEPPYNSRSEKLKTRIVAYCKKYNLGIPETIELQNPYDYESLNELVVQVRDCSIKPVIIIIQKLSINSSINKILWAVLGTLSTLKLIKVKAYYEINKKIVLETIKEDNNFIHKATVFAKKYGYNEWQPLEYLAEKPEE